MAYLEKFLVIKTSTLPNAGNGLFTKTFIPAGTRIVEYKGRVTTWKEVEDDHDNAYLFTVTPDHVIDARKALKTFARYANDARGFTRIKGVTNNCYYVQDEELRVFIEAKRDIPAGSELFVGYGNEYWKVMRENHRIENDKEKQERKRGKGKEAEVKAKAKASGKKQATAKRKKA